jgi:hypothetical protein
MPRDPGISGGWSTRASRRSLSTDDWSSRRWPSLHGGSEQEVRALLGERFERLSPAAHQALCHPEYVLELPQTGERIRGQNNLQAFRASYPDPPTIQPRRLVGAGDLSVVEAIRTDTNARTYVVAVIESRNDRIWRDTRWFGSPLEAPAWRAQWTERMKQ